MLPKTLLPLGIFPFFLRNASSNLKNRIHEGWTKAASPHRPKNGKQSLAHGRPRQWRVVHGGGRERRRSNACTRALMAPGTRLEDDIKQQVQRSVHCRSRWMSSCGLVNRPPTPSSSSTPYSFPPRRHVSLQKRPTRFVLRTASCTKASASFPRAVIISIDLEIG